MPVTPGVGTPGGQQYPVLRSIQTFLQQMAEGGARTSATVIKELLQNADDAVASEVAVILDERPEPRHLPPDYVDLIGPSLLVRNNARFRIPEECAPNVPDDFTAIRDVARGHKRAQATAAGRFGIGFNSVYFLADTPLLFSRREVHIFDLLHRMLKDDGWRFSLDDFPANAATHAGPIKNVIDWCLPRAVIGGDSFSALAMAPRSDFHQTIFRLPLRRTPAGTSAIYEDRFPDEAARLRVLHEMVEEGARSILFLKHVTAISFSVLRDHEPQAVARIETTPPPSDFAAFLEHIREFASRVALGPRCECRFGRTITTRWFGTLDRPAETTWNFHVEHVGRFDDEVLLRLREHLGRNDERAIPWVSVAIPLDVSSCRIDGRGPAAWRVFLPLLERGPSATVFSAHLFIGPSRQRVEFRLNESDEGRRRTEWNKALAERALIPLLHHLSFALPDIAGELLDLNPREYLALFPSSVDENDEEAAGGFTGLVRQRFGEGVWHLRLPDIWGDSFELFVGDEETSLEMVPEWLLGYRDRFRDLRAPERRFVRYALGDALAARLGRKASVVIRRQPSLDLALAVLRHQSPPGLRDLIPLLQIIAKSGASGAAWDGVWAFAESESGQLLRYDPRALYVLDDSAAQHEALDVLRRLRLRFEGVTWVRPDVGLAAMAPDLRPRIESIVEPSVRVTLELLRRLPGDNAHDQVQQVHLIRPIIDFLIKEAASGIPTDARLGFLVRTAHQKHERRALGIILLRPPAPTASDDALWEVWFRRVFAEVDPGFASEINRLLSAHPGAGAMLHAQSCSVATGEMKSALAILHALRVRAPEVYERLQAEMNGGGSQRAESALRVSAGLIESADAQWDRLGPEEQYTVRALPIHRRPDGRFTSLVHARGGDPSGESEVTGFRLQSNEDIEDAPITLPACQLLQTANAGVRRFYRRRLGLEEHGRVAVMKDVLRQIGEADSTANEQMLGYLASTYAATVRRLEATGDDVDNADAQELRLLFESARTVPCLDGSWRAPSECLAVWRVADRLTQQGWPEERLAGLLGQLFHGEPVAAIEQPLRRLVQQLHELREHDPGSIGDRALSSDSPEFSFRDRAKVLADNWGDDRGPRTARSAAAGCLELPVLVGQGQLAGAEALDEHAADLPVSVRRVLSPHAVDVRRLAGEVGLQAARVRAVLAAFGVPTCSAEQLNVRLGQRFAEVWPLLGKEERLRVLRYVGEHRLAQRLRAQAAGLDTVLVSTRDPTWRQPARVLSPKLAESDPPCLSRDSVPEVASVEHPVRDVWSEWCGVQTLAEVLALVLEGAARLTGDLRTPAAAICQWLERRPLDEELRACLRGQRWVLARRGDVLEFQRPADVLVHQAARILGARFWVPAVTLPDFAGHAQGGLGFMDVPPATPDTLRRLGECLAERTASDEPGPLRTYALVGQILDQQESLEEEWLEIASGLAIYRTFRREERQLTSLQLFLGDSDYGEDLSRGLLCLRNAGSALPGGLVGLYRRLGVEDRPTVPQVLIALASVSSAEADARAAHGRLVAALESLPEVPGTPIHNSLLNDVRVLSCAGSYEAVSRCYYDEEFGQRRRVSTTGAVRLIETNDRSTQRLIGWLRARRSTVPVALRGVAQAELAEEPQPIARTPDISYLLLPWQQWVVETVREGSALAQRLVELGLTPPREPLQIVPVETLRVRFRLDDGQVIEQAARWGGPLALGSAPGRILVRALPRRNGSQPEAQDVAQLDSAIAREVALVMGDAAVAADPRRWVEGILATLERPSTVLRRLRDAHLEHFLHQYHDQVADPEFAELFDEYQRTVRSSKRAAELKERLTALLKARFVNARAEQIRGYGYDEFSVVAELLQNAEDAYIQRAALGMEMPETCDIAYGYVQGDVRWMLDVEHRGRPFNYWQHGARQDRNLARDVEGVLRSAGSFKPHAEGGDAGLPDVPTTGRFGLGFKSVYLLSDRPEIHSGPWHFCIEAGCLPHELSPPGDLDENVTRIRLPLRDGVEQMLDASQLLDLVPFLRMITRFEVRAAGGTTTALAVASTTLIANGPVVVERVSVSGADRVRAGIVQFLRCRSREHAGQLAILLGGDGTPARWDDAFRPDLFAALPLRARLGCGVAASHRFEVQSGRTHLVERQDNERCIDEVAGLLEALVESLPALASENTPLSELLARFWALWRWDRGDSEAEVLRKAIAHRLVALAEHTQMVPTLDPQHLRSLAGGPCFFFSELPDAFREALVGAQVAIQVAGLPATALMPSNVVAEGFAGAYRRASEYTGVPRARTLARIGWDEVALSFRERPLFAETPQLLSCLAATLNDDQSRKAAAWVALCRVLGVDGEGGAVHLLPGDLLLPDFPGMHHLPARLLRRISSLYDVGAWGLLREAGLRECPSSDDIREWLQEENLSAAECVGILRYLAESSRFKEYWDLIDVFRSAWFPGNGRRATTTEAIERELIPEDVLADEVFRAWLGLVESPPPLPARPSRREPRDVLEDLFDWWQKEGAAWTLGYEQRVYPGGRPPVLQDHFYTRDPVERREWITLLILGALHTMGRTQPWHHREFLGLCDRKGWLEVFADREHDARRWMQVLEEYLDEGTGALDYYQWMKQFVVIFQISRWLPEYVEAFLNVNRFTAPFGLDGIIAPRRSPRFSGGGPDAPSLTRGLGMGACFVLRELTRLRVLRQPLAYRYCYVAPVRVCVFLEALGCPGLQVLSAADRSSGVGEFVGTHLGAERATFGLAFDLPLLAVADDLNLQNRLLRRQLPPEQGGRQR